MTEEELFALRAQVTELRRKMKLVSDWHDTMSTPLHRKIWFWVQGYNWASLGTWYTAPWNKKDGDKYNGVL
jgi:hypothetical protein